jgi:hypothetical protein
LGEKKNAELLFNGHKDSFCESEEVLKMDGGDG